MQVLVVAAMLLRDPEESGDVPWHAGAAVDQLAAWSTAARNN
jgi:hypothetical protein